MIEDLACYIEVAASGVWPHILIKATFTHSRYKIKLNKIIYLNLIKLIKIKLIKLIKINLFELK